MNLTDAEYLGVRLGGKEKLRRTSLNGKVKLGDNSSIKGRKQGRGKDILDRELKISHKPKNALESWSD